MSLVWQSPDAAIHVAVEALKRDGCVHPDASFTPQETSQLRREITYRDSDFLARLSRKGTEELVVDSALAWLAKRGYISPESGYDKIAFDKFRTLIKAQFTGRWTSVTPLMERLIYALTAVRQPQNLIELGPFWGNTLAWFAGPAFGPYNSYAPKRIIGIEIDREMVELAKINFSKIPNSTGVELIEGDAREVLKELPAPFDFLYIEAKSDDVPGMYLKLIKEIYDKLPKGAWVIAHDATCPALREELRDYLAWVRDKSRFSESICFDVDAYGLELSIK